MGLFNFKPKQPVVEAAPATPATPDIHKLVADAVAEALKLSVPVNLPASSSMTPAEFQLLSAYCTKLGDVDYAANSMAAGLSYTKALEGLTEKTIEYSAQIEKDFTGFNIPVGSHAVEPPTPVAKPKDIASGMKVIMEREKCTATKAVEILKTESPGLFKNPHSIYGGK